MYKDPEKQREANRERQRRYKAKQKALLNQGVTDKALPESFEEFSKTHVVATLVDIPNKPKRGPDIKCFEDLPPDVQATINQMSRDDNGGIVKSEKAKRTIAAIKYQHLFPDRFYSAGVA